MIGKSPYADLIHIALRIGCFGASFSHSQNNNTINIQETDERFFQSHGSMD